MKGEDTGGVGSGGVGMWGRGGGGGVLISPGDNQGEIMIRTFIPPNISFKTTLRERRVGGLPTGRSAHLYLVKLSHSSIVGEILLLRSKNGKWIEKY